MNTVLSIFGNEILDKFENANKGIKVKDTDGRIGICFDKNATIGDRVLIKYSDSFGLEMEFGTISEIIEF